jgi:hypothetical protein
MVGWFLIDKKIVSLKEEIKPSSIHLRCTKAKGKYIGREVIIFIHAHLWLTNFSLSIP